MTSSISTPYAGWLIYSLLTGILRHMTTENPRYPNFLKKNPEFVNFHRSLNNLFRKLREEGVGAESKQTATTVEEENMLLDKGILNTFSPKGLFRAVFYYNGKNFVLRGGQEHRKLQLSQTVNLTKQNQYEYAENASKNRSGGLAQLHVVHKKVPICANPTAGEHCHVYLLDKYFSKLQGRRSWSHRYRGRWTNVGSETYESHKGPVAKVLTQQ